jgi:hypothetical protein
MTDVKVTQLTASTASTIMSQSQAFSSSSIDLVASPQLFGAHQLPAPAPHHDGEPTPPCSAASCTSSTGTSTGEHTTTHLQHQRANVTLISSVGSW